MDTHTTPVEDRIGWDYTLREIGCGWVHDGNPRRPYARLTENNPATKKPRFSNVYFNCAKLEENPILLGDAARDLVAKIPKDAALPDYVCGSAYGAIKLADRIALLLTLAQREGRVIRGTYTEEPKLKDREYDANVKKMLLKRCDPAPGSLFAFCQDTMTTGGTTGRSIAGIEQKGGKVLPYIMTIVNRSGRQELYGRPIYALVSVNNARIWDEGENPFTPDGRELVPPVYPKASWTELTKAY